MTGKCGSVALQHFPLPRVRSTLLPNYPCPNFQLPFCFLSPSAAPSGDGGIDIACTITTIIGTIWCQRHQNVFGANCAALSCAKQFRQAESAAFATQHRKSHCCFSSRRPWHCRWMNWRLQSRRFSHRCRNKRISVLFIGRRQKLHNVIGNAIDVVVLYIYIYVVNGPTVIGLCTCTECISLHASLHLFYAHDEPYLKAL